MNLPEFTSREAVEDFIHAAMRTTGVVALGIRRPSPAYSTEWLRKHWDVYFTPEQQEKILVEFTTRRLSK